MSTALVAFVLVLLVPLFLASWRVSTVGLASQGAIMAWLAYERDGLATIADGVRLVDLALVRALLVPLVLFRAMAPRGLSVRNDVIAPNLISWALALVAVLIAFRFAAHMPMAEAERPFVAAATAALLLAMLVLASGDRLFSQAVGLFRFENALALFELARPEPDADPTIRGGLLIVTVTTAGLVGWYLRTLLPTGVAPTAPPGPEAR